jgi:tight adherence protein C
MSPLLGLAVLLGLGTGVGSWLVLSALPSFARPSLQARIAPYLLDVSPEARALVERRTADPLPVFGLVAGPLVGVLTSLLDRVLGGRSSTVARLRQSDSALSIDRFRARQLVWGAGGLVIGVLLDLAVGRSVTLPAAAHLVIVIVFGALGVVIREWLLQRAARARIGRIAEELPTVLEFLTLSLSAGESILDALRRVGRISHGELAGELARATAEVAAGAPLVDALREASRALELPPFSRTVDQLVGALERGTPVVEVLRAQAADVRDDSKRELLEKAGAKEVAMLVPLVFLILPVTVAFAVFPATLVLRMGF